MFMLIASLCRVLSGADIEFDCDNKFYYSAFMRLRNT